MIYKLHYWFFGSGANVFSVLIGVFIETYTDASPGELGTLLMIIPFLSTIFRPIICSIADRKQAHRKYLITCLIVVAISYVPFVIIPFLGESIYRDYARTCWYIFIVLKVIGDVAFGGVTSIGDSLAINYANRIGTSFTVYRVWSTVAWMFFGIVIGQVNEVETMPKYVPGFLVLILASLMDALCIWLWPKEYFEMSSTALEEDPKGDEKKGQGNSLTKSLMPKEVVWAQAKQKLLRPLLCCGMMKSSLHQQTETAEKVHDQVEAAKRGPTRQTEKQVKEQSREIDQMTQLKILFVLFRRDARILLYLVFFTLSGAPHAAQSFFYISLSNICHTGNACNFSQLAGFLQVSTAVVETLVFIYIADVLAKCGRVNMAAISMLCVAIKFSFYGTIWTQVSPYYSLIVEGTHGMIFGIHLTLMVVMGDFFAGEVKYIIPELLERSIIPIETDTAKLKYSLAATMQAIIGSAFEGFGKGLGALAFGLLLDHISYEALWLLIGISGLVCFAITIAMNIVGTLLGLKLGLDVKEAAKEKELARDLELSYIDLQTQRTVEGRLSLKAAEISDKV